MDCSVGRFRGISSPSAVVVSARYGFGRWPFTTNSLPFLSRNTTAPYNCTSLMINGPDHLDFNFSGNSFSLELKSKTLSFGSKFLLTIRLS
ncbi:hypothetical protein N665_0013s0005 [Sinapis alba]|nr:hypothetical protein N665_0013s0005 [Sinapis alba]